MTRQQGAAEMMRSGGGCWRERREMLIECGKTDSNGRQEDSTKIQKQVHTKYQEKYIKSKTRAREAA
jgi:hypothetical protein